MTDNISTSHYDPESERIAIQNIRSLIDALPLEHRISMTGAFAHLMEIWTDKNLIMKYLRDSFDHLRLDMQYMRFDLEATRSERDQYRQEHDSQE